MGFYRGNNWRSRYGLPGGRSKVKNKNLLLFVFAIMLLVSIAGASALPVSTLYYKFDNNESDATTVYDSMEAYTITTTGATYDTDNKKVGLTGLTSLLPTKVVGTTGTGDFTLCLWANNTNTALDRPIGVSAGGWLLIGFSLSAPSCSAGTFCLGLYNGGYPNTAESNVLNNSVYYHLCAISRGGRSLIYQDGVIVDNVSESIGNDGALSLASGTYFSGATDDFQMWKGTGLTSLEVEELYNRSLPDAPVISNFSVTAFDVYDNSTINNFTVNIDGTDYTTTTGEAITNIYDNDSSLYTVIIKNASNNQGLYFNSSYTNYNVSSDKVGYLYQTEITFISYELFTNLSTATGNLTINGTPTTNKRKLRAGSYNISSLLFNDTVNNRTYLQKDFILNFSALFNGTVNLEDLYTTVLTINVLNAFSGANISNFSGNITHDETGGTVSFNVTTGTAYANLINGTYLLYVEADGYAVSYEANYKNISVQGPANNTNVSLWSNNSVRISIYDSETAVLITSNVSITVTGNASETVYYTATGEYFLENLTDGNYSFKFIDIAGNYSLVSYLVTVADRSTQILNAYLTQNAEQVVFTFKDSLTSTTIEGATVSQSKLIGIAYVLIESKLSDITGRVQFNYIPTAKYRFIATKSGYDNYLFYLDPVLFSTYTVNLDPITTQNNSIPYAGVSTVFTPKFFTNNNNNSLLFIISSPTGELQAYDVIILFNNTYNISSGSNAYGEELNVSLEVLGATIYDEVKLVFYYETTLGQQHNFTYYLPIKGTSALADTFAYNIGEDYGLGWFERVIISVGILIIVVGVVFLLAGATPGLVIGLTLMGYFAYIGFVPVWAVVIAGFVGLILLSRNPGVSYG